MKQSNANVGAPAMQTNAYPIYYNPPSYNYPQFNYGAPQGQYPSFPMYNYPQPPAYPPPPSTQYPIVFLPQQQFVHTSANAPQQTQPALFTVPQYHVEPQVQQQVNIPSFPNWATNAFQAPKPQENTQQNTQYPSLIEFDDPFELKEVKPKLSPSSPQPAITPKPQDKPNQKRCKKCSKYYTEDDGSQCRYHTGTYKSVYESKLAVGRFLRWTCCKMDSRDARGCKVGNHVECEETTAVLSQFNSLNQVSPLVKPTLSPSETKNRMYPQVDDKFDKFDEPEIDLAKDMEKFRMPKDPPSNEEKLAEATVLDPDSELVWENNKQYIRHFINMTDTLRGLAIRYGVSVDEIKTANKLMKEDDIWAHHTLLIPYNGQELKALSPEEKERYRDEMRKRMVRRFKKATKCANDSEAIYYLQASAFNFTTAIQEFKDDLEWESRNKNVKFTSVKA